MARVNLARTTSGRLITLDTAALEYELVNLLGFHDRELFEILLVCEHVEVHIQDKMLKNALKNYIYWIRRNLSLKTIHFFLSELKLTSSVAIEVFVSSLLLPEFKAANNL